jgi:hypothetical protein
MYITTSISSTEATVTDTGFDCSRLLLLPYAHDAITTDWTNKVLAPFDGIEIPTLGPTLSENSDEESPNNMFAVTLENESSSATMGSCPAATLLATRALQVLTSSTSDIAASEEFGNTNPDPTAAEFKAAYKLVAIDELTMVVPVDAAIVMLVAVDNND